MSRANIGMALFKGTNPASHSETGSVLAHRGGRIRTGDLLLPKQALYQAKLRPERPAR